NADAFGLLIDGTIPKAVRERLEQARSEPAGHAGYQYAGLRHLKDRPRARKGRVFGASSYLAPWGVSSRHFESREPACRATPTRRVVPSRSSCSSKGMACFRPTPASVLNVAMVNSPLSRKYAATRPRKPSRTLSENHSSDSRRADASDDSSARALRTAS